MAELAKQQGSRDNITVIVVYLKEPTEIAKQSWPSNLQQQNTTSIMENVYENPNLDPTLVPPVNQSVTMDALGNTNQVN